MSRREQVEHTEDWQTIESLVRWPEQREYELLRPVVVFGDSPAPRARETGVPQRTLYEKADRFDQEGMPSLFAKEQVRGPTLDAEIRRLIVDLKVHHPPMSLGEIAQICSVQFEHRPSKNTIKAVLRDEPAPLFPSRHYPPYRQMSGRERRLAVVRLHAEGWRPTSIASYLKVSRQTVYEVLRRWVEEGPAGLEDKPRGRPEGVSKIELRAINETRKIQENPELGEYRVSAALEQIGIYLSPRSVGRILAMNRELYGLKKPKKGSREPREMPFQSNIRHEIWSVDVRYVDHQLPGTANVYSVTILENHSRCILASALSTSQDLTAYLSVLHAAIERYGAPEVLVSDGAGIFKANQAKSIYRTLKITKETIEKRQPWQNFVETTFAIQKRMVDYYFKKAETWEELVAAHDRWVERYNTQKHQAHEGRTDSRHSPGEVLGFLTSIRHLPEDLERAFFSTRFTRVLDASGYARLKHWRIYAAEGLARRGVTLWLGADGLAVEFAGDTLARYEVEYSPSVGGLRQAGTPRLFATRHHYSRQLRLFGLDEALGKNGWLKALRLDGYASRRLQHPHHLQEALFSHELTG